MRMVAQALTLTHGAAAHTAAAANVTWWNMYDATGSAIGLPTCDFGPYLLFVGNYGTPGSATNTNGGSRRRLEQATAPVPAPLAAAGAGGIQGTAMSTQNFCAAAFWSVQQLTSGNQLYPPDVAGAMVAARLAGRM